MAATPEHRRRRTIIASSALFAGVLTILAARWSLAFAVLALVLIVAGILLLAHSSNVFTRR
jgi:hypothetical protein